MIEVIIKLFLVSIVVEAITEIIVESEFTYPFRNKWKKWTYPSDKPPQDTYFQKFKVFIDKLISCGYCTSVWVSAGCAIFLNTTLVILDNGLNIICLAFITHRLSNLLHVVYEIIRKGRVKTHDLFINLKSEENGTIGQRDKQTTTED